MTVTAEKVYAFPSLIRWVLFTTIIAFLPATEVSAQNDNTVATPDSQVKNNDLRHDWQLGAFFVGGFPLNYVIQPGDGIHFHEQLDFYNAGFEAGRMLTEAHGAGFLRGRGEAMIEVIPFWLAHYPSQKVVVHNPRNEFPGVDGLSEGNTHGVSITPLLFRWNFMRLESRRVIPWVQLGSGLLWTSQPFPQQDGPGFYTSRINFTPQVDLGVNVFTVRSQSINLAAKVIHISSADLGEYNPGIPVSLQFGVGYSWWK